LIRDSGTLPVEERFMYVRNGLIADSVTDEPDWKLDPLIHFAFLVHYVRQGF
jgi:hypothetical protein